MSDIETVTDGTRKKTLKKKLKELFSRKKRSSRSAAADPNTASPTEEDNFQQEDEDYAPTGDAYNPTAARASFQPSEKHGVDSSATRISNETLRVGNDAAAVICDQDSLAKHSVAPSSGSETLEATVEQEQAAPAPASASSVDSTEDSWVQHSGIGSPDGAPAAAAAAAAAADAAADRAGESKLGPHSTAAAVEDGEGVESKPEVETRAGPTVYDSALSVGGGMTAGLNRRSAGARQLHLSSLTSLEIEAESSEQWEPSRAVLPASSSSSPRETPHAPATTPTAATATAAAVAAAASVAVGAAAATAAAARRSSAQQQQEVEVSKQAKASSQSVREPPATSAAAAVKEVKEAAKVAETAPQKGPQPPRQLQQQQQQEEEEEVTVTASAHKVAEEEEEEEDDEEYAPEDYEDQELRDRAEEIKRNRGFLGRIRRGATKVLLGRNIDEEQAAAEAAKAAAEAEAAAAAAVAAAAAAAAMVQEQEEPPIRKFPRGFMWGTGTSAYQVEGAYLDDGKGMNIWDAFSKSSQKISGGAVADVSCCHYYRYKEDVALMREMGVKYYKLSLSWSRLIPTGRGKVNERGVAFYNRLINELLANKIMPVVVLYHWDLPLTLQMEEDGWLNPKIVDHFVKYAKLCFSRFGDRVRHWITINEPWTAAVLGHDSGGQHAPGRMQDPSVEVYRVGHHMLMAHARTYQVYQKLYRRKFKGKIGLSLNGDWYEAKPSSDPQEAARNQKAAERALEFTLGWFARPLYKGDYPAVMRERVGNRLPRFTKEQASMVKGSVDFFALNHYSSHQCEQPTWYKELAPGEGDEEDRSSKLAKQLGHVLSKVLPKKQEEPAQEEIQEGEVTQEQQPEPAKLQLLPEPKPAPLPEDPHIESTGYWQDISVDQSDDDVWKTTDMGWGVHPEGLRKMLNYIQTQYNPKGGIIITENGCAVAEEDVEDSLRDIERAQYMKSYLTQVHKAIVHDDVDVRGYFVWSLLDNFEWGYGYTKKFGLHYVDMQTLERIPKLSANWYAEVCKKNRLEMV